MVTTDQTGEETVDKRERKKLNKNPFRRQSEGIEKLDDIAYDVKSFPFIISPSTMLYHAFGVEIEYERTQGNFSNNELSAMNTLFNPV